MMGKVHEFGEPVGFVCCERACWLVEREKWDRIAVWSYDYWASVEG